MQDEDRYELVPLANGAFTVRSRLHAETFHPVIGPAAEAEALYVYALRSLGRAQETARVELVVWDVGLGAAANALAVLRATRGRPIRLVSFDRTLAPLRFAFGQRERLGYFSEFQGPVEELLARGETRFEQGGRAVCWRVIHDDFPARIAQWAAGTGGESDSGPPPPLPHAVLFDPYSPAKNPDMWTMGLFRNLFELLSGGPGYVLATYSRSTLLRVTLLIAGFFVGTGPATGEKEQTTVAADRLERIERPLDRAWLERARRSTSAEPLTEACYRQAPLSAATWELLRSHPQFRGSL